jgi:glucose/arabinose dehydrogenase
LLEDRLTPTTLPPGFQETLVAGGLHAPTAMEFAPDGRLFVAEQGGSLRVIENGVLLPTPFLTLPVNSSGERGLLGIAFDPAFTVNHYVYVYYTTASSPIHNRVSRFTAAGDVAVPGSEVDLLDLDNLSSATNHNGGAIHFGLDGKLYIGVGENANGPNAQSLGTLLGKMLRINPDGSIPTDNPFYATATGVDRAIWALGLRNPFTFAVQPGTGQIFINDVGESTWEEIDVGVPGANYGWPVTEGPTSDPRFHGPLFAYGHGAGNTLGCAITGGTFYDPLVAEFPAAYTGSYFFADLCNGWIRRLNPADGSVTGFATGLPFGTVDLKVSEGGSLFFLSRGPGASTGAVYRIDFPSLPSVQALTPDQRFVARVFLDLLERPVDAVSLARYAGLLDRGASRLRMVQRLQRTPEYRIRLVQDLYRDLGLPDPGPHALRVSAAFLGSGGSVLALRARLLGSPVYFARRGGGTLAGFTDALVRDVLGRPATAGDMALVTGLHSRGVSLAAIAGRFVNSGTGRQNLAAGLVERFLRQSADPGTLAALARRLRRPAGYEDVVARLLASPAYLALG